MLGKDGCGALLGEVTRRLVGALRSAGFSPQRVECGLGFGVGCWLLRRGWREEFLLRAGRCGLKSALLGVRCGLFSHGDLDDGFGAVGGEKSFFCGRGAAD